jgi:hypothetical protein
VVPLFPFGIRKYDEGERFDLRLPYAEDGWVDPDEVRVAARRGAARRGYPCPCTLVRGRGEGQAAWRAAGGRGPRPSPAAAHARTRACAAQPSNPTRRVLAPPPPPAPGASPPQVDAWSGFKKLFSFGKKPDVAPEDAGKPKKIIWASQYGKYQAEQQQQQQQKKKGGK